MEIVDGAHSAEMWVQPVLLSWTSRDRDTTGGGSMGRRSTLAPLGAADELLDYRIEGGRDAVLSALGGRLDFLEGKMDIRLLFELAYGHRLVIVVVDGIEGIHSVR